MFESFTDTHVLRKLYEIQTLIKNDPEYYVIMGKLIKEIEKPVTYTVLLKFKDGRVKTDRGFTTHYVRDGYLYLKRGSVTLCYNMDEMIFYQVVEIKQEGT